MDTTFDWVGDDMPAQWLGRRPKLIHSVGVVANGKWIASSNAYTGIFQGCDNVFIRLSVAAQPTTGDYGYTPALSLKCFRNGAPSSNLFAMYSLEGQTSWNFFAHDLSNHVPDLSSSAPFILQELRKTFAKVSDFPSMIGLHDLAKTDQTGKNISTPHFPFRVIFHPTTAIHNAFPSAPSQPFYKTLVSGLQTPGPLYEIWAQDTPASTSFTRIGTLQTTSPARTSNFGDRYLFFQHVKMEGDFVYQPSWKEPAEQIMAKQRQTDHWTYPDLPWV
jgi:hypothetical protein